MGNIQTKARGDFTLTTAKPARVSGWMNQTKARGDATLTTAKPARVSGWVIPIIQKIGFRISSSHALCDRSELLKNRGYHNSFRIPTKKETQIEFFFLGGSTKLKSTKNGAKGINKTRRDE